MMSETNTAEVDDDVDVDVNVNGDGDDEQHPQQRGQELPNEQDQVGSIHQEALVDDEDLQSVDAVDRERTRRGYRRRRTLDPLSEFQVESNHEHHDGDDGQDGRDEGEVANDEEAVGDNNSDGSSDSEASVNDANNEVILLGRLLGYYAQNSNESMSEQGGNEDEDSNNNIEPPQPARNHSYLPTPQPLYPEEWLPAGQHRLKKGNGDMSTLIDTEKGDDTGEVGMDKNNASDCNAGSGVKRSSLNAETTSFNTLDDEQFSDPNELITVAIMEMDNVVLFPGAILPLRLRDPNWLSYLGEFVLCI